MKLLKLATLCLTLAGGFCVAASSASPASEAETAMRQQVDSESGGQIKLTRFSKTDGQTFESGGVQRCKIDFEAEVEFEQDGQWLSGNVMEMKFNFSTKAPDMMRTMVEGGKTVHRGDAAKIAGVLKGEKWESGWKFEIDESRIISVGKATETATVVAAATAGDGQKEMPKAVMIRLLEIESGKLQWNLEQHRLVTGGTIPTEKDIAPYIRRGMDGFADPSSGGKFLINAVNTPPEHTIYGRVAASVYNVSPDDKGDIGFWVNLIKQMKGAIGDSVSQPGPGAVAADVGQVTRPATASQPEPGSAKAAANTAPVPAELQELFAKAQAGDAQSQLHLGEAYTRRKNYEEAVRWFRQAADQGNARAQMDMGIDYENGRGVEQDFGQALNWYRKSADQGNMAAEYFLGRLYQNGKGVDKDQAKAREWFQKSADQGFDSAKKALE